MKSKAPLVLLEQVILLLVFALAAVLCLQAFVWSGVRSQENAHRDGALVQAQNAAELLKASGGDYPQAAARWGGVWDGRQWTVYFDEQWVEQEQAHTFVLRVAPCESGLAHLGKARITVSRGETLLTELEVCWQEVTGDGT